MKIKIAQKFKPFSHVKGEKFLFPGTTLVITTFPTRLEIEDLMQIIPPKVKEWPWTGPVKGFTAELDYDREELKVFGFAKEGYFSYVLKIKEGKLVLHYEKKETVLVQVTPSGKPKEKLSLGSHKAQDLSRIRERLDPAELFPLWLQVAFACPKVDAARGRLGQYALLKECEKGGVDPFLNFFQSAFHGCFIPRLIDTEYQGMALPTKENAHPLPLLIDSVEHLLSLFYKRLSPNHLALLPGLPKELHCGRFVNIPLEGGILVHFEWTKKALRRVVIENPQGWPCTLTFPKSIASCRIRKERRAFRDHTLALQDKGCITLDRFSDR